MLTTIRQFQLRRTLNVFLILKIAFAIALVYQLALTVFDHMFTNSNSVVLNQTPFYLQNEIVFEYFNKRKNWLTSNLGAVLFKNQHVKIRHHKRKFVVLVWRYWGWLKTRHLSNHSNDDPLDTCRVKNCIFTGDDKIINSVDAVLVHIQHGTFPQIKKRRRSQIWIFLTDESPYNTFSMVYPKPFISKLANVFNWSMTYRSDADVPVPYGRTVALPSTPIKRVNLSIPFWQEKQKGVLVTALISHCAVTKLMDYVRELQKYIKVEVYGKCPNRNKKGCPGNLNADCPALNRYHFYLAFENSECRQYFTEKIFYNAYSKGAIPIVMGPPVSDCETLLPPHSYLHVDNFTSPKELAMEIFKISMTSQSLQKYHEWRYDFEVVNEHGYFKTKSYHLCRLCEALNFNCKNTKFYDVDNLRLYLEPKLLCKNKMKIQEMSHYLSFVKK